MVSSISRLVLVASLIVSSSALGVQDKFVREARQTIPHGFLRAGVTIPSTQLDLKIAVKSSNLAGLHARLSDVSDPASTLYGQHLTREEASISILLQLYSIRY